MRIFSAVFFIGLAISISAATQAAIIVGGPATASPFSATVGNGNFEADSGAPLAFDQVTNWHNLEGADDTVNFGQTSGMGGSPEVNSQGGFIFGQMAANDTGYAASIGDVFDIDFYANRFGGGYAGDEAFNVVLFTSSVPVNAATTTADITVLDTTSFAVQQGWSNYTQDGIYTSTVADTIYLGFDFDNGASGTSFPRMDVITWEVTPIPEPGSSVASLLVVALIYWRRRRS